MSQPPPTQRPAQGRTLHRVIIGETPAPSQSVIPVSPAKEASRRGLVRVGVIGLVAIGLIVAIVALGGKGTGSGGVAGVVIESATSEATPTGGLPTIQVDSTPAITRTVAASEDLPGTPMPDEGNGHIEDGAPIRYKNYPPTSGTHYVNTTEFGFSLREIPEGRLVHSLEHGAIVLYFRPDLPDSVKISLRGLLKQLPPDKDGNVRLIVTPYPKLQTPMALAAWTRLLPMAEFDFVQIWIFYRAWMGKGPEGTVVPGRV